MAIGFDSDFLKKLEYLHVVSKKAFAGQARAERLTPKRGRGLEFADYRQYSAGDDFRHIDWKAYRRLGRLLLRLFDEEQDLPIYLFIDASQSMAPAGQGPEKRRAARAALRGVHGAGNRNRTYDLRITNAPLYQLSYSGRYEKMAPEVGLEPTTP